MNNPSHFSRIGFCRSLPRRDDEDTADPGSLSENAIGNARRHTDIPPHYCKPQAPEHREVLCEEQDFEAKRSEPKKSCIYTYIYIYIYVVYIYLYIYTYILSIIKVSFGLRASDAKLA